MASALAAYAIGSVRRTITTIGAAAGTAMDGGERCGESDAGQQSVDDPACGLRQNQLRHRP
jgi:hypothetical protein